MTVTGGRLRSKGSGVASAVESSSPKAREADTSAAVAMSLTQPELPRIHGAYSLLVTGIGGTGVITIGHLLGMAAHLEGKAVTVLDMTGLAQKNGAVMSFIRFAEQGTPLYSPRIGIASADAVIGCDLVVTAGRESLARMAAGRTRVVANAALIPTSDFTRNADWNAPSHAMEAEIAGAVGLQAASFVDATRLATALLGDAIATNMFMLGFAWQRGLVPVSAGAIDRAIELNAVAVEANRAAFAWGRMTATDLAQVERITVPAVPVKLMPRRPALTLAELVEIRRQLLMSYQDEAYASNYTDFVTRVREAERRITGGGSFKLTEAVAANLAKLMAYKDEYEVARLYTDGSFLEKVAQQIDGNYEVQLHLAPPLWAKRDPHGKLQKRAYGCWVFKAFRVLSRLRRLRGTPFDVFGYTSERRGERALIEAYRGWVEQVLARLHHGNLSLAIEIARIPEKIRGFGHVRAAFQEAALEVQRRLAGEFTSIQPNTVKAQAAKEFA